MNLQVSLGVCVYVCVPVSVHTCVYEHMFVCVCNRTPLALPTYTPLTWSHTEPGAKPVTSQPWRSYVSHNDKHRCATPYFYMGAGDSVRPLCLQLWFHWETSLSKNIYITIHNSNKVTAIK